MILSKSDTELKIIHNYRSFFLSYYPETTTIKNMSETNCDLFIIFYQNYTSLTLKYVDKAILKLEANEKRQDLDWEPSVLEKLLKKDRHAAVVMAMDMLFGGVDTVSVSLSSTMECTTDRKVLNF